ncbi:MAG: porin [Thermodesulfobacteriota bacterium]
MKRFTILAVALVALVVMAAPALATDVTFKGTYRVRGYADSTPSLDERVTKTNSFMDQRFRLETVFTVNDILSFTTRFDALDDVMWGDQTGASAPPNIDIDRAWMTIKTDFGKFDVGRMQGGSWGTLFVDSERDVERIKYTIKIGDFIGLAIMEKQAELDALNPVGTQIAAGPVYGAVTPVRLNSDTDQETYYLAGVYKLEAFTGGLLVGYTNGKTRSDRMYSANPYDAKFWTVDPYFEYKIMDFTVSGEAMFRFGDAMEFDRKQFAANNNGIKDIDWDAYAWNLEGRYVVGPLSFQLGYAWMQGQGSDPNATKVRTLGNLGIDWDKLWILTCTEDPVLSGQLGYVGNINGGAVGINGAKIIYLGAGFKPMENVSMEVVYGNAKAESPIVATWSADYGNEYDLKVVWNIYDNLSYTFIAAYLDSGDFWQQPIFAANPGQYARAADVRMDDVYSLFNELQITF